MPRRPALAASLLVLSAALPLAACAPVALSPAASALEEPRVEVSVVRDGVDWSVDYVLDRDASAWAFFNSALLRESRRPWRPDWWTIQTPGVVIERIGNYDVLRATECVVPSIEIIDARVQNPRKIFDTVEIGRASCRERV